jgi:hypothetical protein
MRLVVPTLSNRLSSVLKKQDQVFQYAFPSVQKRTPSEPTTLSSPNEEVLPCVLQRSLPTHPTHLNTQTPELTVAENAHTILSKNLKNITFELSKSMGASQVASSPLQHQNTNRTIPNSPHLQNSMSRLGKLCCYGAHVAPLSDGATSRINIFLWVI